MPKRADINDPSKIGEVRSLLASSTPVVIFFFKKGCPYCISTDKPWKKLTSHKSPYVFVKVDSGVVPPELDITGFPHFEVVHPDGKRDHVPGSKDSEKELKDSLHLQEHGGLRQFRRTTRNNSRRLLRRTRKRTHRSLSRDM